MKTRQGLWNSLALEAGVLADWRWALGSEFDKVTPFLQPTQEQSQSYPCTEHPACHCTHEIRETDVGLVAVCTCGGDECSPIWLEPKDTLIYALNGAKLGEAVRRALGFDTATATGANGLRGAIRIGTHGPGRIPVLFHVPYDETALLKELASILSAQAGPFILATPTAASHSATVEQMQHRHSFLLLPLAGALGVEDGGQLRAISPIDAVLAVFTKRLADRPDTGALLQGIHREIAAVRTDFRDLREAKQRLEQMQAEGLFKFTQKIDARSFKVICAVLAEGDVAKASRTLGLGDSTLRDLLRAWRGQSKAHQAMLDLVRWRKKVGGKSTVPLNEAVLLEKAPTADYPALLADVLDGLLSMTEDDWPERCEELAELLRPHVPR